MAGRKSKYNAEESIYSHEPTLKQAIKWVIAIYIRLSVEDGDDKVESNSIINQRAILNEFVKNNPEYEIYDYYIDDGYSGTDFNRPRISKTTTRYESQKN